MSSIDGERSPKRQRLGSYSPASPPLEELKAFVGAQRTPNTPPPSVRMSPSWQSQTLSSQTNPQPANLLQPNMPTPPNTAEYQNRMKRKRSEGDDGSDHATPATDAGTETQSFDAEMGETKPEDDVEMVEAEHRRTDHERDTDCNGPKSHPGLYNLENAMIHIESSRPSLSEDLLQLYQLETIQASVARRDPVSGEKINRMRKSYENKVKSLALAGRNKATANQGELSGLIDPGWDYEQPGGISFFAATHQGRELGGNVAFEAEIFAKVDEVWSTCTEAPFPKKEDDTWKNLLGIDDASIAAAAAASAAAATTSTGAATSTGGNAPQPPASALAKSAPILARSTTPLSPRNAVRPERAGKKRRYDESSYSGYDGYEDDGQPLKQRMRV